LAGRGVGGWGGGGSLGGGGGGGGVVSRGKPHTVHIQHRGRTRL